MRGWQGMEDLHVFGTIDRKFGISLYISELSIRYPKLLYCQHEIIIRSGPWALEKGKVTKERTVLKSTKIQRTRIYVPWNFDTASAAALVWLVSPDAFSVFRGRLAMVGVCGESPPTVVRASAQQFEWRHAARDATCVPIELNSDTKCCHRCFRSVPPIKSLPSPEGF